MKIHFFRSVWEDTIILQDNGKAAFIDTGLESRFLEIRPYLGSLGISHIEFILLTHFHRDHYGSLYKLITNYDVDKVYFKDYSGLDISTAWGIPADKMYREAEMEKCTYLREKIKKHSSLYDVKDVTSFNFGDGKITLYHTEDTLNNIYEDAGNPDTYHRIIFNENENCCAALLNIYGKNIYFGGDISDSPASHPLADHVNLKIAKVINEKIDIYKVPHHGTNGSHSAETLSIFKPDTAIITNGDRYLRNSSTIYDDLRRANPDVSILNTENSTVVTEIDSNGRIKTELK